MRCALLMILLLAPAHATAHELVHQVTREEMISIGIAYPNGAPFAYESYRIHRPDEEIPFQTGRTDARGRIAILPDRPGDWRLTAISEDGHGVSLSIPVDSALASPALGPSPVARILRILSGVGWILGIFGLFVLLKRRK